MRFRRPYLTLLILLALGGASLLWLKREGLFYRFGAWRAESLLEESAQAGHEGNWREASAKALAALQLNRGNFRILHHLYSSLLQLDSPDTLIVAGQVFAHPEASLDDKISVMEMFLRAGDHVTVARYLATLTEEERKSATVVALGARLLLARGRPVEALALIDRLRSLRNEDSDLLAAADALSRIRSEDNLATEEAQRIIDRFFHPSFGPAVALKAFTILGRIPPDERHLYLFSDAAARLESLETSFPLPAQAWLLASEIELSLHPESREAVLDAAISRWIEKAPEALGKWLLSMGEPGLVVKHFSGNTSLRTTSLLSLRVRAHLLNHEWEAASALINEASPSINPVIVPGLQAYLATRSGNDLKAGQFWNRSLYQAELANTRQSYFQLSRLAELGGNKRIRNLATAEALKIPSLVPVASSDVAFLFSDLRDQNQPTDLLQISLNLLGSEPGNAQLLNNVVWLELLHGIVNEERIAGLSRLVEQFPTIVGIRTTLAFARIQEGKVDEALKILDPLMTSLESKDESLKASDRAVAIFALIRNGEAERARFAATHVEWNSMMKIEEEFFKAVLVSPIEIPDQS